MHALCPYVFFFYDNQYDDPGVSGGIPLGNQLQ